MKGLESFEGLEPLSVEEYGGVSDFVRSLINEAVSKTESIDSNYHQYSGVSEVWGTEKFLVMRYVRHRLDATSYLAFKPEKSRVYPRFEAWLLMPRTDFVFEARIDVYEPQEEGDLHRIVVSH